MKFGACSISLLLITTMTLVACSSSRDFDDIRAEMQRLDERPTGTVPDVPEYESQELFFYSAGDRRSPFRSPIEEEEEDEVIEMVDTGIAPDEDRPREHLESYALDELRMVGHIEPSGRGIRALVVDPSGELHQVQVDQYVGENYGRVTAVRPEGLELMEIVPSGRGGWLERANSLQVAE